MAIEAKHPLLIKAIRIVLVFSLVFWSSLGVEWAVAFGAEDGTEATADAQQSVSAENEEGSQADASSDTPASGSEASDGAGQSESGDAGTAGGSGQAAQPGDDNTGSDGGGSDDTTDNPGDDNKKFTEEERFVAEAHEAGTLVDIEAWALDPADTEYASTAIRSVRQTAEELGYQTPKMSTLNGTLQVIAVPLWQADSDLDANWKPKALNAEFLKWSVVGNENYAEVTTDGGVLTIRSHTEGSFLVTCTVDDGKNDKGEQVSTDYTNLIYEGFSDDYPDKDFAVVFSVEVLGPYIDIELLQSDGTTCAGVEALDLSNNQLESYGFQANVRVYDQVSEGAIDEFRCTPSLGLKEAASAKYGDLFDDLTWQVLDADRNPLDESIATISDAGVLEFKGDIDEDGPIIVRVSSPAGFNQNEASAEVKIGVWKEDPQGESHPQDTLRIVSNARIADEEAANDSGSQESEDESAAIDEQDQSLADESEGQAEEAQQDGDAAQTGSDSGEPEQSYAIDKIYTVAQVEALGLETATFTMQGTAGLVAVQGEGVSLELLLADAGITDLTQVSSIDFIDYRGIATTVTWADITSGTQSPLLAVRSRVLVDGESSTAQGDGGSSAASAEPELLDNTRFRLLFYGSGSVDPDALRWIKQIRVNVEAGDGGVEDESDLTVRVDYVAVPYGKQAVLSAIPSQAIGNARFGFTWETSTDGETWETMPDGLVQTLRIMTDAEHIGRMYRVVLDTDLVDPETGELRSATSAPVTIKEGDGFTATLAYDPPIAGQTAIFQSSVEAFVDGAQITIDPSKLEYVWEKSEDGGLSWEVLPNATGPSFAVPTEPIAEDSTSGSDEDEPSEDADQQEEEPVTLVYVRVRVITTDTRIPETGRVAVSNAQPLTVRVGGAGEDPDGGDDPGVLDDNPTEGAADRLPTDTNPPAEVVTPTHSGGSVTEISNIRVDNTPRPSTETPAQVTTEQTDQKPAAQQSAPTATTNAQELKPDELLINPEVTALVLEQEAAIDQAVTASRPGARWTQLSTVDPTDDDVKRILADNPFAPFALPLGLGIAVAGGLEKLLAFRREMD